MKTPYWIEGEGWTLGPGTRFDYFILQNGKTWKAFPKDQLPALIPPAPGVLLIKPIKMEDFKKVKLDCNPSRVAIVQKCLNPDRLWS